MKVHRLEAASNVLGHECSEHSVINRVSPANNLTRPTKYRTYAYSPDVSIANWFFPELNRETRPSFPESPCAFTVYISTLLDHRSRPCTTHKTPQGRRLNARPSIQPSPLRARDGPRVPSPYLNPCCDRWRAGMILKHYPQSREFCTTSQQNYSRSSSSRRRAYWSQLGRDVPSRGDHGEDFRQLPFAARKLGR